MKTKNKVGRPAKITLGVVEAVGDLIASGLTEEQACSYQGVNPATFGPAVSRNPEFRNAIKRRQTIYLVDALTDIRDGKPGWQGAAWILERRHKPQFNRTDTHAITDPQGACLLTEQDMLELERAVKQELRDEEARRAKAQR